MPPELPHTIADRQRWIGVLAKAEGAELRRHESALRDADYQLIRAPEIGMTLVRGLHQRAGTSRAFNGIHIGAAFYQCMHGIDATRARGQHQRTAAERQLFVGIGTALEQGFNHGGIAARRCEPQRRGPIMVRQARFGASLQQQLGQFCVAAIGGPLQGGGAIGLLRIHVGAAFQQTLDFRLVALTGGVGNVRLRERSAGHRRQEQGSEGSQCKGMHTVYNLDRHTSPGSGPVLSPKLSR